MDNRVDAIVDALIGTRLDLDRLCHDCDMTLSEEELDELYERIFQCDSCGEWVSSDEEEYTPYGSYCAMCYDSYEEDDDYEEEEE